MVKGHFNRQRRMMFPRSGRAGTSARIRTRRSVTTEKKYDPPGMCARRQFGIVASYRFQLARHTCCSAINHSRERNNSESAGKPGPTSLLLAVSIFRILRSVSSSLRSTSNRLTAELAIQALEMAIGRQVPDAGLLAHSDRGMQYASAAYQRLLKGQGITCSMSRKGNCWDNAPMESFFATLKKELIYLEEYQTRAEARESLFAYIELFYNRVRRYSALDYQSPTDFEQAA